MPSRDTMREKRILTEEEEEESRSFSWEQAGNYGPIRYQPFTTVNNLSKEGRALTVTNNYFWQPFNSQTYCPGSGQLSNGSIELGQLRQAIYIKPHLE